MDSAHVLTLGMNEKSTVHAWLKPPLHLQTLIREEGEKRQTDQLELANESNVPTLETQVFCIIDFEFTVKIATPTTW